MRKIPLKSSGFTFIEVIVAVLVLALGLIGLAALQARGVRNVQTAYNRSQAVNYAQDIADRMRANTKARGVYADVNQNGLADFTESPLPNGIKVSSCSTAAGCSKQQMAQTDIYDWRDSLGKSLPKGCGSIIFSTAATSATQTNGCGGQVGGAFGLPDTTVTIVINWDDDGDGDLDSNDPNFMMSFDL